MEKFTSTVPLSKSTGRISSGNLVEPCKMPSPFISEGQNEDEEGEEAVTSAKLRLAHFVYVDLSNGTCQLARNFACDSYPKLGFQVLLKVHFYSMSPSRHLW